MSEEQKEIELLELFLRLDDFLLAPELRNAHLKTEHVTIYVRRSVRAFSNELNSMLNGRNCLDIADITVSEEYRGMGIFRRFLEYAAHVSPYRFLLLENVHSDILKEYAKRHGWHPIDDSFWKERVPRCGMKGVQPGDGCMFSSNGGCILPEGHEGPHRFTVYSGD